MEEKKKEEETTQKSPKVKGEANLHKSVATFSEMKRGALAVSDIGDATLRTTKQGNAVVDELLAEHRNEPLRKMSSTMTEKQLEEALDRLTKELRQVTQVLDDVRRELSRYRDLNRLSTLGAIQYLIRNKQSLDDIKALLTRASRNPDKSHDILLQIDAILKKVDR